MKRTATGLKIHRTFVIGLVFFVAIAALLALAASAKRSRSLVPLSAGGVVNTPSANYVPDPALTNAQGKKPLAPTAAVIVATLTDNITAATKVAPGGTINYTATVTNNGAASPADDATNLNFSAPLDANTTLVAGSVHASPIAVNDTYNWVGNTQLDTAARVLPAVTANDVAVNATGGSDTFTVTAIAGGATALGGTVTLASPAGSFTYTPPLGRPNIADGATVQDSFTYTITNSADPSLTSTGTVRINLTGRVWYLQAGAAGDGRSNTPSSSPAAMSTAADKTTDVFYIFSNAGSLNGAFSVDAGQQLLGQGVNLVVSSITLFTSAAPTPTTTNTAGNCVSLGGAPGNNTLSGFNIGNCTGGTAITGANVGTLNVSTLSINTNGGGLDLTGVGAPAVSIVLGGLTSSGGARNVNLIGLNGTFTLASGTLSGATGDALHVDGGTAGLTYSGTIQNSGARQVNIINKASGIVGLSGAVNGTGTGVFLNANGTSVINFTGGVVLSTGANDAFTATSSGTTTVTGASNTLTSTTGTALNVANTTIGASGVTFQSINHNASNSGTNSAIILNNTGSGTFTVTGTGGTCTTVTPTCTGGALQNIRGADAISLNTTGGLVTLNNMLIQNISAANDTTDPINTRSGIDGIQGQAVSGGLTVNTSVFQNISDSGINGSVGGAGVPSATSFNGLAVSNSTFDNMGRFSVLNKGDATNEAGIYMLGVKGTVSVTTNTFSNDPSGLLFTTDTSGSLDMTVTGNTFTTMYKDIGTQEEGLVGISVTQAGSLNSIIRIGDKDDVNPALGNTFTNGGGVAAVIANTTSTATGTTKVEVNRNTSTVTDHTSAGTAGGSTNYNFPQGGFLLSPQGSGNYEAIVGHNTFDQVMHANGSLGQLSILTSNGTAEFIIQNNTFNKPWDAPVQIKASADIDGSSDTQVLMQNNTYVTGTVGNAGTDVGGPTPFDPDYFQALNGGQLDLTIKNENIPANDPSSGFSHGFYSQTTSANDILNLFLQNTTSSTGYEFKASSTAGAQYNLFRNGSGAGTAQGVVTANGNSGTVFLTGAGTVNLSNTAPTLPNIVISKAEPAFRSPRDYLASAGGASTILSTIFERPTTGAAALQYTALENVLSGSTTNTSSSAAISQSVNQQVATTEKPVVANVAPVSTSYRATIGHVMHHAICTLSGAAHTVDSIITPTVYAQNPPPNAPTSGENVTLNTIATFPAGGKSITIKYSATVNTPPLARQVQTQGTVTANGGISIVTDDPEPAGGPQATVTLVDTAMTWNGSTSTDWNTATNWTQPAGGTQYAPGVSNPAINDVVIPNVGAQPNISATDIGVFSLSIANGRTLTITSPRVLTIGGLPGGDLTLDGIISGGNLNLGTGTHVINNAGGTGSLSATNVATVLSGSTITLNNNLQAGALAVNAGGSMNITNRTLSLNGSGAALAVPGGATFTTTGSTVVFNGTAAQQAAGIAYNNLTINNTTGAHVTGVTLTGNASVAAVLTLTSSDLATGAFTLTMPAAATSGPASGATDVVGNVKRTGFVSGGAALSFGNPFNTIRINSGAAPADITMVIAKNAPTTYAAAVSRSYTITPNGANGPATLRLHYRQVELNGNSETPTGNFNLRKGPSWTAVIPSNRNVGVAEDNWLENNAVASFSEWTFASLAPTASGGVVSGRIVDSNGKAVEGAVVNLSGAQNRKFITDANGFYRFENVETGGFYTVTPSRANYHFNPFNRSFSQTGNQTQTVFTAESMGDNANPLDTAEYFVRQQYVDVLGREPDEAGFNYWSDKILACLSEPPAAAGGSTAEQCVRSQRQEVAAAFFISEENQATGVFIYDAYAGALGRRPAFAEFTVDRTHVVGGPTLDGDKTAFAQSFVQRAEFVTKYQNASSADAFVDVLLQSVHATGADLSGERSNLIEIYGQGADQVSSRAAVLRSLADNATFKQSQYNPAFVLTEYFGYLRRDAETDGFNFWVNVLSIGDVGNYRGMVCSFVTSTEYQNRFSQILSHANSECSGQ